MALSKPGTLARFRPLARQGITLIGACSGRYATLRWLRRQSHFSDEEIEVSVQCQHPWTQALGFPNPPTPHCSVSLEFPWGPGGKSGDKGPGRFSILCLTPVSDPQALRGCVGRPRVCGGTERVPGGEVGARRCRETQTKSRQGPPRASPARDTLVSRGFEHPYADYRGSQ